MNKLADFHALRKQLDDGLITEGEFLMAVQMTPEQTGYVEAWNRLPYKAKVKIGLDDLDNELDARANEAQRVR